MVIVPDHRSEPITAGQRTCATFWNPAGVAAAQCVFGCQLPRQHLDQELLDLRYHDQPPIR